MRTKDGQKITDIDVHILTKSRYQKENEEETQG